MLPPSSLAPHRILPVPSLAVPGTLYQFRVLLAPLRTVTCFPFSCLHSTCQHHLHPEIVMSLCLHTLTYLPSGSWLSQPLYPFPITPSSLVLVPSHQLVCVEWSPILPASFSIWAFYTDSLTCGNSRFFSLEMYWAGKGRVDKLVLKLQLQSKIAVLGFVFKLRS